MVRTQVQFPEEQYRKLKAIAAERKVSIAEVVRQAVGQTLDDADRAEKWRRALQALEEMRASPEARDIEGKTDVGINHDKYLAEIYGDYKPLS